MKAGTILKNPTGAQRLLGFDIDISQPDRRARCRLALTEAHINRHGVLHGGFAASLLDSALGMTASLTCDPEERVLFKTVSLTTNFLAPAQAGTSVTATGRAVGGGRSVVFVEGELVDSAGTTIATATGVFKRAPD